LEALLREKDVQPIRSVDDLVCEGIFDADQELDEFLTGLGCQPNFFSGRRAASNSAFFARMKPSKSSRWERMTSS